MKEVLNRLGETVLNQWVKFPHPGVDAKLGKDGLGNLKDLGGNLANFHLVRELPVPDLGDQVFSTWGVRLPKTKQGSDLVMVQKAIIPRLDFQGPGQIGPEYPFLHTGQVGFVAALKDPNTGSHGFYLTFCMRMA